MNAITNSRSHRFNLQRRAEVDAQNKVLGDLQLFPQFTVQRYRLRDNASFVSFRTLVTSY